MTMPDFLDAILEPKKHQVADVTKGNWLVVGVRAKSSAELEQREAAYLDSFQHPEFLNRCGSWPMPFYLENGELDELTKSDVKLLKSLFGVTEKEYRQLYEREAP
jgi:hypothetical protein